MHFRNIASVRRLGETPEAYIMDVEIDAEDGEGFLPGVFVARVGGGGLCAPILAAIAAGQHAGQITDYEAPTEPPALPYSGIYSKSRLIAALTPTEFLEWMAALDALPAQPRQVYEQSAELERDTAGLFDAMLASMVAAWGEARVAAVMAAALK